jgi:hypothetical protein
VRTVDGVGLSRSEIATAQAIFSARDMLPIAFVALASNQRNASSAMAALMMILRSRVVVVMVFSVCE